MRGGFITIGLSDRSKKRLAAFRDKRADSRDRRAASRLVRGQTAKALADFRKKQRDEYNGLVESVAKGLKEKRPAKKGGGRRRRTPKRSRSRSRSGNAGDLAPEGEAQVNVRGMHVAPVSSKICFTKILQPHATPIPTTLDFIAGLCLKDRAKLVRLLRLRPEETDKQCLSPFGCVVKDQLTKSLFVFGPCLDLNVCLHVDCGDEDSPLTHFESSLGSALPSFFLDRPKPSAHSPERISTGGLSTALFSESG